jgi:Leucine-rich repeat (LRR) protein
LLEPISAQLLWINLARTGVTDDGIASLANHKLLTRLHLENTSISDSSSIHISKLPNLEYLNLYGTNLTDASLNNLKKLKKLKKIFLWKTKITEKGAQNFKRQYVNVDKFDSLITQKKSLQISFNSLVRSEQEKVKKLENIAEKLAIETNDTKNINELCPVTQKQTVLNKFSVFEGRRIGFCCDKCKVKFDKDGAVFRNKIAGFTASNAYRMAYDNLQNAQKLMDQSIEKVNSEIRAVSIELKKMGPEINLGWKDNLVSN